jgi:hypothetical protein
MENDGRASRRRSVDEEIGAPQAGGLHRGAEAGEGFALDDA